MCTDTIPVLAYVKIELFFADICYYQRINPKPITDMAKKIAEQLINTLASSRSLCCRLSRNISWATFLKGSGNIAPTPY